MSEKQPVVGWSETKRLIQLDLETYASWLPRVQRSWPAIRRFAYVLFATEMFGANLLYRLQTVLYGMGIDPLGGLLSRLNRIFFTVSIGPNVRIGPGLHLVHGHLVIDGTTTIGANCSVAPFVTIGLSNGSEVPFGASGPTLGDDVGIGTGAKVLGPIRVGDRSLIGANAVVVSNIPADHTAVGIPARARPSKVRSASSALSSLREEQA